MSTGGPALSARYILIRGVALALIALFPLLTGAGMQTETVAATVSPTTVLGWDPGIGQNISPAAPVTLYFNRDMNRSSVESAWQLTPAIRGSFSWSGDAVTFRPAGMWRSGQSYRLTLGTQASSVQGIPLAGRFSAAFTVGDRLRTRSYSPLNGTVGVPANGLISVTFNHPMVPLAGLSTGPRVPRGWHVSISPSLTGYGSWLGTSTWIYRVDGGLRPSTRYTVTVRGTAQDASGEPLGRDLRWSFRTLTPEIFSRSPRNNTRFNDPRSTISVTFDQPMDHGSTASAFAVRTGGRRVAGSISWKGARLDFHPSVPLSSASPYIVSVAGSARSANRAATLGKGSTWEFKAAPPPHLAGTSPRQGGLVYDHLCDFYCGFNGPGLRLPYGGGYTVSILFNTPMSKASLDRSLQVQPKISHLQTAFFGQDNNGRFQYSIFGDFAPSKSYTVRLTGGVTDAFGRPLGSSVTFSFKTAPLHPSVALYGISNQGSISASAGQAVPAPIQLINVPKVRYQLIKTDAASVIGNCCYQGPPNGTTVRSWTVSQASTLNKVQNTTVKLVQKSGSPLAPGIYYLSAEATGSPPGLPPDETPPSTWEIVLVRNLGVTVKTGGNGTLVWVTSEQTGKPASGMKVKLLGQDGGTLASGTTGSNGLHLFKVGVQHGLPSAVASDTTHYGLAESGWMPAASLPNDTPFFWFPGWYGFSQSGTYLYTDRPVYRAGHTVHFRGVLWHDGDGVYSPLGAKTVSVQANDPNGHTLYYAKVKLDRFGSVHGSFQIPAGAHTGDGQLWVSLPNGPGASTSFTVAEYRKPEFLTTVTSAAPSYVQGQTLAATASVRYVFDAPVTHEPVHWIAYSQPQFDQPPGWDDYTFFDWETYWQQLDGVSPSNQQQSQFGNQIASGTARTGANGKIAIHIPLTKPLGGKVDQTVTLEATATDVNHQSVSGRVQVPLYVSALDIGLDPTARIVPAGQQTTVNVAAVHHDGTPYGGAKLTATISRRTYSNKLVLGTNGQSAWEAVPHDTAVSTQDLTADASGKAAVTFTPSTGGEYVISVSGKDAAGNVARTAISIDASGPGFTDWGATSNTSIALKADKTTYTVGDTAHIIVAAPFADSSALVTVERGNIRKYWIKHLASNAPTIDVPITLDDLPNIYMTVTLYKGSVNGSPPDWRYGVQELHVKIDPRHVTVKISAGKNRYHPGDRVTYRITTTDAKGHPVSTQLSLALVDTAVLALKDESNADILQNFYGERQLGVSTASDGAVSIDNLQVSPDFRIVPPNGEGTVVNGVAHSAPQAAAALPKPGGGGGGPPPAVTVRSRFADTAYWSGSVVTDGSGRASISLRLPDNATTWRLDARGVTAAQGVGQADLNTLATQDLILRPALPRFFVQGDTLHIGAALNDTLGRPASASISLAASGLHARPASRMTVTVPAHGERYVQWTATVPGSSVAQLVFTATSRTGGVRGDAVRLAVPVHAPLTDETVATAGQVYGGMRQAVIVPAKAVSWPGALTVQISSSLTAGLGDAFAQLTPHPYDSNDDFAGRVLAATALYRLPISITGLAVSSYRQLPSLITTGVRKLLDDQYGDGGWPWFNDPMEMSDPMITADAVQALAASGWQGSAVRSSIVRGRQYLLGQLPTVPAEERSHLLLMLSRSGGGQAQAAERLYADSIRRLHLDPGPLADLGTSLAFARDRSRSGSIASVLDAQAVVSATGAHWESGDVSYWSGPAIATTTDVLAALLALRPHDPFVPAAVRWLMLSRDGSAWDCPHDTAQAIATLAAYARAAREGHAAYSYRLVLNGRTRSSGRYGPTNQRAVARLQVPVSALKRSAANMLAIGRQAPDGTLGSGPLYYLARLRYFLDARDIVTRSEGVSVSRQYTDLAGHPIAGAKAGTAFKVQLTVHTSATLYYLDIEDPIPAGCEPIDETLNTSQQGLQRPQQYWWTFGSGPTDLSFFLSHSDLRDDRVSLYSYFLPPGTYHYTYLSTATVTGHYSVAPTHASEAFFPEVFGRSAGMDFVVR